MAALKIKVEHIQFLAEDGYSLSGKLYHAEQGAKANIVVACATGVPQAFYRRFAEYAAQSGFQVLTFDYRGVAASAPKQLKGFKMSYLDWGKYDLSAAIDYLGKTGLDIYMVGHSYGGQALGLSHSPERIEAMYCYGTGAGWHGYMPLKRKNQGSDYLEYCISAHGGSDWLFAMEHIQDGGRLAARCVFSMEKMV